MTTAGKAREPRRDEYGRRAMHRPPHCKRRRVPRSRCHEQRSAGRYSANPSMNPHRSRSDKVDRERGPSGGTSQKLRIE
jgi:hypothetical protein